MLAITNIIDSSQGGVKAASNVTRLRNADIVQR